MLDNDKTSDKIQKRLGRPPKGAEAVSDAQRQQAYRRRKRDAAYAAWDDAALGKLALHSTNAVLDALTMAMQQADDTSKSEAARSMAGRAVADLAQELARRYATPKRDGNET